MGNDVRLENYLSKLEAALRPFPASDRAEIITEMKSHVLSALERDPTAQLDSVLSALGEPVIVANRYLMERGFKTEKPPISPFAKWIVIGFLGTMAMFLVFVAAIIWKFSPLIKIDGDHEKLSLLGGMIQLSGDEGTIHIGDFNHVYEGTWSPSGSPSGSPTSKAQVFQIKFNHGKMELVNSEDSKMSWKCTSQSKVEVPQADLSGASLDFGSSASVKCELSIPKNLDIHIVGKNGKITLDQPHYNVEIGLGNGKVGLTPDETAAYQYSLSLVNGKKDHFDSSPDPKAYRIKVQMENGKISRE